MGTMIRRAALLALAVPVLASCGSKSVKQEQAPPPEQLHSLFPQQAATPQAPPAQAGAAKQPATAVPAPAAATTSWPLMLTSEDVRFQVHEPLLDSWRDGVLAAGSLVVAESTAQKSVNGWVAIKALTQVDSASGVVVLQDLEVTGTSFSGPAEATQAWQEYLRWTLPDKIKTIALSRLESGQAVARARQQSAAVSVKAPNIIISEQPAVLVYIDGEPRYVAIKGTQLMGLLNTRVLLLRDAAGMNYLHLYNGWVRSASLQGPWEVASPTFGAAELERAARASGRVNLLPGKPDAQGQRPTLSDRHLPRIIVSTQPTALIVLDGAPRFARVPGTSLEYATNTTAHLFRDDAKRIYVRIGGTWFRASALTGPWEYLLTPNLPADFWAIPDNSPKGSVKRAIANTQAGAPTMRGGSTVVAADRRSATLSVIMSGDPVLKPIPGTQLNYVANASVPIIQVDVNDWYAVQEGVWFYATEATGPWTVTSSVPPQIYSIPPTVPIYNAIQSRAISSSTDVVYYGYPTATSTASEGGAIGVEDQGADYQYTPPSGLYWNWSWH